MRQAILATCLSFFTLAAHVATIGVVGLFPGKAVLVVDGGSPRTYSAGSTIAPAVRLVAASQSGATIAFNGRQEVLAIGQHAGGSTPSSNNPRCQTTCRVFFLIQVCPDLDS